MRELQARLLGAATDQPGAISQLATDGSIMQADPLAVVYPANTADVRKTVQFAADHIASASPTPVVARGLGLGQSGGAVAAAIQVVLPAHMNKLLRLDKRTVTVQPGITFRTLEQTLITHSRHLPCLPLNLDGATIGGAIAEDAPGLHAVKYGSIRQFVQGLKVVLADGSLIETKPLTARQLRARKGLTTLEGQIYRDLDNLLLDHEEIIKTSTPSLPYNNLGYALSKVRQGRHFDLGQIFIGSGGTLGIITEATLSTAPYSPRTTLVVGYFTVTAHALEAASRLAKLKPSALELADRGLLEAVMDSHPGFLDGLLPSDEPATALLVQFDNLSQLGQRLVATRAENLIKRFGGTTRIARDPLEQVALWKLRSSAAQFMESPGSDQAVPFMDGAVVPIAKLPELLTKATHLLGGHDITAAMWGHVGDGNLNFVPRLSLSKKKDADKLIILLRDYTKLVAKLGGTPSGTSGDGLLHGWATAEVYGEELAALMAKVKLSFDPRGIFSPGHKSQATLATVRASLRPSYQFGHHHHQLTLQ
jgi:FAD/FMN-containing dehydrogenase